MRSSTMAGSISAALDDTVGLNLSRIAISINREGGFRPPPSNEKIVDSTLVCYPRRPPLA
jgi:hypothetical protein